jgi:hypothetical protein
MEQAWLTSSQRKSHTRWPYHRRSRVSRFPCYARSNAVDVLVPYLFEPQVDLVSPDGSLPSKWSPGDLSYRLYINEAAFSLLNFGIRVEIHTHS